MSNNRKLVSDIQELDKGITECENFLTKVLSRKTDSSRQVSANKKKNVPSKSTARPQSRGARQRTPSVGANSARESSKSGLSVKKAPPTVQLSSHSRRVSPERLTKPESNEILRKRSNSVSRLASQGCRCEPTKPIFADRVPLHIHVPNVSRSKESQEKDFAKPEAPSGARPRSMDPRNKHLSWGEILRGNNVVNPPSSKSERGHWDIGGYLSCARSAPPHPSYTTKLPHECEPIKDYGSQSSECTAGAPCNHFLKVSVAKRPQEESFSSEGTSGFSSNNDLPSNMINRSIQCGSPIPPAKPKSVYTQQFDHRRISSSSSSGASSQKEEKEKVVGVLGSDVFTMFNPVRTLNFLVKELQGMVQKHSKEDGSVCRIIADMEKVLHRLPEGGERAESPSGYMIRSKPQDSHSVTSASTRSYNTAEKPIEAEKAVTMRALQAVPALAKHIDQRIESMRNKIVEAKTHIPVPSFTPISPENFLDSIDNIFHLQRYVEKSGHQLEIMCQTMEKTCEALRIERNALREDLEERDKKLRIVKSQEQDFVTTVTTLRTNLETTTRRVTQLSVENKILKEQVKELPALKYIEEKYKEITAENIKLKEENKIIPALRASEAKLTELKSELTCLEIVKKNLEETVSRNNEEIKKLRGEIQNPLAVSEATRRLTQRLQDTMKERDDAQHDVQMLRIEREKLLVLTQTKDEELSNFVKDILNIKKMVSEELDMLKSNIPQISPECISDVMSSSLDSDEMTSETSHCQPMCSSPTSTASAAPPIDEVWQDISTIIPEHTRSSPEIFISPSSRKIEETVSPPTGFQSLAPDTWQSVPTSKGNVPGSEDDPPRPHTAIPGPRLPALRDMVLLNDNQWCGAAAVTQELQHNVEELFRLIKSNSKLASSSSEAVPTPLSSACSSKHPVRSGKSSSTGNRNIQFKMPKLPDPPKFLETPEFSDFSSYHGSLADTSSIESIDAVLKELQKENAKQM